MKKKGVLLVLAVLLLTIVTLTAGAQEQEVLITIWQDGREFTISPEQTAVIRSGWSACTKGLTNSWTQASYYEVWLNDELLLAPEDIDALWGPVTPNPNFDIDACIPQSKPYSVQWRYPLEDLPPGEYELRSITTILHTLVDGGDYDGDGQMDLFTPENYYFETVNTIIVEE